MEDAGLGVTARETANSIGSVITATVNVSLTTETGSGRTGYDVVSVISDPQNLTPAVELFASVVISAWPPMIVWIFTHILYIGLDRQALSMLDPYIRLLDNPPHLHCLVCKVRSSNMLLLPHSMRCLPLSNYRI